ncbi:MAG TPA: ubiquinone/menaquinone biosynthesis methyltransferase [candidate division Zixibacteria bacterium]|nr:ubiquinone/menaquinone biosynthesis methyltransferase [candidate division Zixibacteria bacterium]
MTRSEVVGMFDHIAPLYDAMNTLMTAGIDARWRSAAVAAAELGPGMRVLDVACGTGKLALACAQRVRPGGEVVGLDASLPMLRRAVRAARRAAAGPAGMEVRLRWVRGDAMALPFVDGTFDALTIGFGLRNLPDAGAGLREMARVLLPGGRLVVLEVGEPPGGLPRLLYETWFRRAVPVLGRVAGRGSAYAYLPRSVRDYPRPDEVAALMREAGLERVTWRWLTSGMVTLHVGRRSAPTPEA